MELVSMKVEGLGPSCWGSGSRACTLMLRPGTSLMMLAPLCLALELSCAKRSTGVSFKSMYSISKMFHDTIHYFKGFMGMYS